LYKIEERKSCKNYFGEILKNMAIEPYFCRPKNFDVMLAVVKIAGQQFKVKAGDSLFVPHIEGNTGDKVDFTDVLMTDNGGVVSISNINATVKAEITKALVQGDKVIAFKMKRRKGFRKKHGHRTHYTQIKIESIA
jgi:large subunit ribosomal protein L21